MREKLNIELSTQTFGSARTSPSLSGNSLNTSLISNSSRKWVAYKGFDIVSEEQFFQRGSSGGTLVSTGLEVVHDIIMKRFHPSSWNIYLFQCSDGDNWPTDNIRVLEYIRKLELICQLIGYCEIEPREEKLKWMTEDSGLSSVYKKFGSDNVKTSFISAPTEIWPAFTTFFEGKR